MIYLIITTSINTKYNTQNDEHRKKTYLDSIEKTLSFVPSNIKPIIVENNGIRETFLDIFQCDIYYTENNFNQQHHKGINELEDIKSVINKYNIEDEDIIIKITGRYHLINNTFLKLILDNQDFDAYIKFFNVCTSTFCCDDSVLGLYAMRCKYLKQFNYDDFSKSPETEFALFIRNNINVDKIYSVENLDLRCCFADDLRIVDV
jgi:hypothetical protein